jgi:hypothetical protein
MANLLYPVDMSSFSRPENDTKFRDLIMVLQQQMGVAPTGVLTTDEFNRLAEASSRYVDGDLILLFPKQEFMSEDGSWASAAGTRAWDGIADRLSVVRIFCDKVRGTCELHEAIFDLESRSLYLDIGTEYQIDTWTPRVTAKADAPCSTSIMTIDVKGKQVTAVTVPKPNCTGFTQAIAVASKISQDRMNKARMLVYPPATQFMPIQK